VSELSSEITDALDATFGLVVARFVLTRTPAGAAPVSIKEQWIGVALPVREILHGGPPIQYEDALSGEAKVNMSPVQVVGIEAVSALRQAVRNTAAEFWAEYAYDLLIFRAHEGELQPLDGQPA